MEHDLYLIYYNDFWNKRKIYSFDPHNVFLAFATNILMLLMTGSASQISVILINLFFIRMSTKQNFLFITKLIINKYLNTIFF